MSDTTAPRPKPAPPKPRPPVEKVEVKQEKPKKPFVLRPHLTQRALLNNPHLQALKAELAEKEQQKPVKRNPRKK